MRQSVHPRFSLLPPEPLAGRRNHPKSHPPTKNDPVNAESLESDKKIWSTADENPDHELGHFSSVNGLNT
jgi:hypothetical protein